MDRRIQKMSMSRWRQQTHVFVNWTLWPESPKSPNHDVETILKARFTGKIEIDVVFSVLDRTFST
jgi:hypothetical protein